MSVRDLAKGSGSSNPGNVFDGIDWADADQGLIASVLDQLSEGFVLFDETGALVFCNKAFKSFYAMVTDLLVPGTRFEDLVRACLERGQIIDVDKTVEEYIRERIGHHQSGNATSEQHLADGRWVLVSEHRLDNGWVLGTRMDISEVKHRENAHKATEERLADAVGALQEGFALFDPDDRLVICNEKYKSYFPLVRDIIEPGVPFEKLIRSAAEQRQNIESMSDPDQWVINRLRAHAQATGTFEHKFSDGRYVWVSERKTRDGSTLSTYVDITELKLHENELVRARKVAETASRAKSDFLANMSHEFRTPLNAIIGFTEVMVRQMLGPIENEQYRNYLDSIYDSGSHLLHMVNDLLDMEKIEANELALNEEIVDLNEIIAGCKSMLSHRAETSGIALYSETPERGPFLIADETALKKAMINVVSNAVKFTPEGGSVAISSGIDKYGDITIRVVDTGEGIDKEDLERIQIPFVQVGRRRTLEGTGLGLSITRSLVELHGGTLKIESEPGQGTTVTITLPKQRITTEPAVEQRATG